MKKFPQKAALNEKATLRDFVKKNGLPQRVVMRKFPKKSGLSLKVFVKKSPKKEVLGRVSQKAVQKVVEWLFQKLVLKKKVLSEKGFEGNGLSQKDFSTKIG